jgi:hypothetical protein
MQAQAEATKEAQRAGIAYVKTSGDRYRGHTCYTRPQLKIVQDMLGTHRQSRQPQPADGLPYQG